MNKREIGFKYEKMAGEYLAKHGYTILEYNFSCKQGEIDIVARHEKYLVFVEVKYRSDARKGSPLEAISLQKQRRICGSALYYVKKHGLFDVPVRFDVVGILGDEIVLIQNAFDYVS